MRVISGSARGSRLDSVENGKVRPTTDRVKEALFSIIQFQIEGRRFLDLFGGTGQIGIEAVSRGAKEAIIVDNNNESLKTIKNNVIRLGLNDKIKCIKSDALKFLEVPNYTFDLAFLDPPYKSGLMSKALIAVANCINTAGVIITETPIEEEILEKAGYFTVYKRYKYGKIMLNVYKNENVIKGES